MATIEKPSAPMQSDMEVEMASMKMEGKMVEILTKL